MATRIIARPKTTGHGMFLICLLTCVLTATFGIDAAAQQVDPSAIVWSAVPDADVVLTVSGPGGVFHREFKAGDRPLLTPEDAQGLALADGRYTWEVRGARVQSGYFSIQDGLFLGPRAQEASAAVSDKPRHPVLVTKDQVISEDLIVDGLLCAGHDCVNNESFGSDTLRLKMNNVRLKFDDTSNSFNYPKNDWQITINDKTNGGAERFSIEDVTGSTTPFTITAGAPTHSLHVDQAGQVGFGTSTPGDALHVITGDSPSLRLDQDASMGFLAHTWAVGGNEAHFFVEDVSNSSAKPFRVAAGAPTSSLEVHSSGRVGVATNDPDHQLEVHGSGGDPEASLKVSNSGEAMVLLENRSATEEWTLSVTDQGLFQIVGDSGDFTMDSQGDAEFTGDVKANGILLTSDRARKTDFRDLEGGQVLEALAGVPVSNWIFKSDAEAVRHIGPMAQDFYQAFGTGPDDRHISPMDMGGVALAAIQELHKQMTALLERNAELEARLAELERSDE